MKNLVIFQIRYNKVVNRENEKYIIICKDEEEAKMIASDVYSLDGVSYLKITDNKKAKIGRITISANDYKKLL